MRRRTRPIFKKASRLPSSSISLREGRVAKRAYVQTSSTGYPAGFAPPKVFEEHPVDVALLPMDCANLKASGATPNLIDTLKAPDVIFCHWEDFFEPKAGVPKEIMKVDLPALRAVRQHPDTAFHFPALEPALRVRLGFAPRLG